MTEGRPLAAVAALSAALAGEPERADLWGRLATALLAAGRPADALDAAGRLVRLAPGEEWGHRLAGEALLALGRSADPADPPAGGWPGTAPYAGDLPSTGVPMTAPPAAGLAPEPPTGRGTELVAFRSGPRPGAPQVPVGASRWDPGWRPVLTAIVRTLWLLGTACYVGLVFPGTAPYTAGALAGVAVLLGAYARLRIQRIAPPPEDRAPTAVAGLAALLLLAVIPAAMLGALGVARAATVAAVTCATAAAVLLGRTPTRRSAAVGSRSGTPARHTRPGPRAPSGSRSG